MEVCTLLFRQSTEPSPLSYGLLADVEYAVGNFKESLLYVDKYLSLEDSISLTAQRQLLADAEQRHKNALLKRDVEQQQRNSHNILIVLMLYAAMFATTIVIIILQRKQ